MPAVRLTSHHNPFGMVMPSRSWEAGGADRYRFGFNGHEYDNAIKGDYNSLDFGERIYDPRIGKFLSIDPLYKNYPWQSGYIYFSNNPILNIDYKGLGSENDVRNTPDGGTISLPAGAEVYTYDNETDCEDVMFQNGTEISVAVQPGSVKSFKYNGRFYDARWDSEGNFMGYALEQEAYDVAFNAPILTYSYSTIVETHYEWNASEGATAFEAGAFVGNLGGGTPPAVIAAIVTSGVVYVLHSIEMVSEIHDFQMTPPRVNIQFQVQTNDSQKTMDELIPGSLKRSKSWDDGLGNETLENVENQAKNGNKKAKDMLKLYKQQERLKEKNRQKGDRN